MGVPVEKEANVDVVVFKATNEINSEKPRLSVIKSEDLIPPDK